MVMLKSYYCFLDFKGDSSNIVVFCVFGIIEQQKNITNYKVKKWPQKGHCVPVVTHEYAFG